VLLEQLPFWSCPSWNLLKSELSSLMPPEKFLQQQPRSRSQPLQP